MPPNAPATEAQLRRKGKEKASISPSIDNPFIAQFRPPANETEEERIRRARAFQDAQRVSKEIDESLQETKRHLDRRRRGLKLLLLGTSMYQCDVVVLTSGCFCEQAKRKPER
ncbi:hypothetical protein V5O48_005785 [Marasmius crinis-equi]|uniref:Uncharacterized protein n=1 Tax=Marasmius crinis-equi TaxID=585013 RepID=A0ABR3FLA1_9AGAR